MGIRGLKPLLEVPSRTLLTLAGRVYVPGKALEDAMDIARGHAREGHGSTIGYFHGWHESAPDLADINRNIISAVAALQPKGYVSVKAPAFRYASDVLAAIVTKAMDDDALVHFDSHDAVTAAPTLACVAHAQELGAKVGLTIPGRWRRSADDADTAQSLGVKVRVVKGEWPDPLVPDLDPRSGFLEVIDRLAGRAEAVAVATHDPWLAREALKRLQAKGTRGEMELLHGLPKRSLLALAAELQVPVRFYVPFGIAWRPYALRKALQRPRILWWILRDSLAGLMSYRSDR